MSIKTFCAPSSCTLAKLFADQLEEWPEAAGRYHRLDGGVLTRPVCDDGTLAMHNADRAVSSLAPLDAASVAARPCFLCESNRPMQQRFLAAGSADLPMQVLVNPFPIFSPHFVIASAQHRPQLMSTELLEAMAALAQAWPELTVFYNGPRSGASAPDHLHLQAVESRRLPLWEQVRGAERRLLRRLGTAEISVCPELPQRPLVVASADAGAAVAAAMRVMRLLPRETGAPEGGMNVYAAMRGPRLVIIIVPRRCHRPESYHTGELLLSPGAVDMAGVMVCARRSDYDRLGSDTVRGVMREVSLADEDFNALILNLLSMPQTELPHDD